MSRQIPRIDVSNFEDRFDEISEQVIKAAKETGFFILCNQDFPSVNRIGKVFDKAKLFFQQPAGFKQKRPFVKLQNTGYENLSQIRPSTMSVDQKESLQLQLHRRETYWPLMEEVDEEWNGEVTEFISEAQALSLLIMKIFGRYLKFPDNFFPDSHNISKESSQSTLRMLHYYPLETEDGAWRAGPHTDFDCLTLLFQETGDAPAGDGLEICPGRETFTEFGYGDKWTPVPAKLGDIVVNIGDMLMSWSDDEFKSTFHRVRPIRETAGKERFSVVWFNQANKEVVIQGPQKKYPATTGLKFIQDAMERNYSMLSKNNSIPAAPV